MTTTIDQTKLTGITLAHGGHETPDDGLCYMEWIAYATGEPHTDHPKCVSQVLYLGALLVATVVAVAGWIGVHTARPHRATDTELLALADTVRERPGRHACDTPTTVIPVVKR